MFACLGCGLPFLAEELPPQGDQWCPECKNGQCSPALPEPELTAATEAEIRAALAQRWNFVSAPSLSVYLNRLTRQIARRVDGAPQSSRVVLVDDRAVRSLALPSGTLLISLGALEFLDDEAELAFVLGHELAHAASGDVAVLLLRLGFHTMTRDEESSGPRPWAWAAEDLLRLGYGRRRERDADARALGALLALRYDPESVVRYLQRLQARLEQGDPQLAELATSHPTPQERMQRMERALYGRVGDETVLRVNREVFRRAAGPEVLRGKLVRSDLLERDRPRAAASKRWRRGLRRLAWTALGIGLLALLILLFGLFLSG